MGCCVDWITHGRARFVMQSVVSMIIVVGGFSLILMPPILSFENSEIYVTPGVMLIVLIAGRWFTPVEDKKVKTREEKRHKFLQKARLMRIAMQEGDLNVESLLDENSKEV